MSNLILGNCVKLFTFFPSLSKTASELQRTTWAWFLAQPGVALLALFSSVGTGLCQVIKTVLFCMLHTYIHKEYLYSAKEQKSHNALRSQLQASPNKYVFRFCLKTGNVRFGRRRSAGGSFHNRGPVAVKLLSPNRLCVAGTDSIRMSLEPERSGRRPISDSWRQSPARYTGATPASDW